MTELLSLAPDAARAALADWLAGHAEPGYRVTQIVPRLWQRPARLETKEHLATGNCMPRTLRTKNVENEPIENIQIVAYLRHPAKPQGVTAMRSTSDVPGDGMASADVLHYATRTIVFADVVESVRLMQRDEFAAAGRIRDLLLEAANETIPQHRGQLLQRLGDGLMISFASSGDATGCARAASRSQRNCRLWKRWSDTCAATARLPRNDGWTGREVPERPGN